MFKLFGSKKPQLVITEADKTWIEENIIWFIEIFGFDVIQDRPFILPASDLFPYNDLSQRDQFQQLFEQVCSYWNINPEQIDISIFDNIEKQRWIQFAQHTSRQAANGLFSDISANGNVRYKIELAKSNEANPQLMVTVIAHELAHVKLLGENHISEAHQNMEEITDLATIFMGFGVFMANSCETKDIRWMSRNGYLPNEIIAYTNALICYITGHKATEYLNWFNINTQELFEKSFLYLEETNHTLLSPHKIRESDAHYKTNQQIANGYAELDFDAVINGNETLIRQNPKSVSAYNSIGYALLQQRKYEDAIQVFTHTIGLDPYYPYPHMHRGYCQLMLDHLEDALYDLESALQLDESIAQAWRNMGVYYLKTGAYDQALSFLEKAAYMSAGTPLINFYLGQVYLKNGDPEKAATYFEQSVALKEHNDSTFI